MGRITPKSQSGLNNLTQQIQATNRLGEAEPLSERHLQIFLRFTQATGHEHPHLRAASQTTGACSRPSARIPMRARGS